MKTPLEELIKQTNVDNSKFNVNNYKHMQKIMLLVQMQNIWMNKITLRNLPEEIRPEMFLEILWYNRYVTFFYHEDFSQYFLLPIVVTNIAHDPWGKPSSWHAFAQGIAGPAIAKKKLDKTNSVLIPVSSAEVPPAPYVINIIEQMCNVEFTKRLNINAFKMPIMVKSDDKNTLNDLNKLNQFLEAVPVLLENNQMGSEIEVLNLKPEYVVDKLDDANNVYYSQILEFMGCKNSAVDKKERLLTSEVSTNNSSTNLVHDAYFKTWERGIEQINKLFNLDIEIIDNEPIDDINDYATNTEIEDNSRMEQKLL